MPGTAKEDRVLPGDDRALLGEDKAPRRFRAPGRVNLIGDHTDYNDGFVLPMAIDRDCVVTLTPTGRASVTSLDARRHDSAVPGAQESLERFVAAVSDTLHERGMAPPMCDVAVRSEVPTGVGLSSSAALSVCLTRAFTDDAAIDAVAVARMARDAEEVATGVASGLMDQLASACGVAGHALLIDCEIADVTPVPLGGDLGVVVIGSGITRVVADSEYLARRRACEAIARRLGAPSLRHVSRVDVEDEPLARHVVDENDRVLDAVDAVRAADLRRLGRLMTESHASLRDDYAVSTPALDRLVDLLVEEGAAGARLTGAGFGGCAVAVALPGEVAAVGERAAARYAHETGNTPFVLVPHASDGAGPLP